MYVWAVLFCCDVGAVFRHSELLTAEAKNVWKAFLNIQVPFDIFHCYINSLDVLQV